MSDAALMAAYYDANVPIPAPPSVKVTRHFDVRQASIEGMSYWTVVSSPTATSRLLYVHGGAFVNEIVDGHWAIIAGLARRTGATVHVPLYPLAPRHTWRDAFTPLLALIREIRSRCAVGGFSIAGDSAGAGLALSLCQLLRDVGEPLPDRIALLSPFLDLRVDQPDQVTLARKDRMLAAPGLQWAGKRWAGDVDVNDARVAPLNGSLSGLPPMLVMTGTSDLLHSDALRLRDKADSSEASLTCRVYDDMFHVWMAAPIPEADSALDEIAGFLRC